ncbi:hypothetical protein ACFYWS_28255 [Streptomyces sp. NPDC002795]|uniref:hypothetical protein n=1 Tax=Streptomyces sp. NPDC002795 TaxID=3364665 RepID=UPI0036B4E292
MTADRLLTDAEHAFQRAEFTAVRPLLHRLRGQFGTPDGEEAAVRYAVLRAALAARVGDWQKAVRRCPDSYLHLASTGVVHGLAVSALRRLAEEGGRHTESGTAALAIVLWAHLLDEDDPGDFRALLTGRRSAPARDELWEEARRHLLGRINDLLHALDVRGERDVLAAWETAWEAERADPMIVLQDTGPDGMSSLEDAAWHLVDRGRHIDLLDAYTARHPDPGTWTTDSPDHRACRDALAQALAIRGKDQAGAKKWSETLADFSTAARLGNTLDASEREAVLRAGHNVGRSRNGYGYSPITRSAQTRYDTCCAAIRTVHRP